MHSLNFNGLTVSVKSCLQKQTWLSIAVLILCLDSIRVRLHINNIKINFSYYDNKVGFANLVTYCT